MWSFLLYPIILTLLTLGARLVGLAADNGVLVFKVADGYLLSSRLYIVNGFRAVFDGLAC